VTYDNRVGVTEEHFRIAKENGIDRKMVLQRVRDYHWDVEKAISLPISKVVGKMKCPVCGETAKQVHQRNVPVLHAIKRRYECDECLTEFNTSEQILLSSIPEYIRNKYIDKGEL
jgi:transposase-like protein